MNLQMINAYFGDCFVIENHGCSLVVDFGTHRKSRIGGGRSRMEFYEHIGEHLLRVKHFSKESNLLVTHFHEDHVSGLIHMMRDNRYAGLFDTLLIPDVFSSNKYERVLVLLILEDILKNWKLGEKKCTLYDFVKFFCTKIDRVVLLKRGDTFKEYTALWPDMAMVNESGSHIWNNIVNNNDNNSLFFEKITDLAKELAHIVRAKVYGELNNNTERTVFEKSDAMLTSILNEEYSIKQIYHSVHKNLNDFGNEVSIVFQNSTGGKNLIFTGDIDKKNMESIKNNYDSVVPMYPKYEVVKVSHHGTYSHYFNWSSYKPKFLLIPNGQCETSKNYCICNLYYKNNCSEKDQKVICSNFNWCNKACKSCKGLKETDISKACGGPSPIFKLVYPFSYVNIWV